MTEGFDFGDCDLTAYKLDRKKALMLKHLSFSTVSNLMWKCPASLWIDKTAPKAKKIMPVVVDISTWAHRQIELAIESQNPEHFQNVNWQELRDKFEYKLEKYPKECPKHITFDVWRECCKKMWQYVLDNDLIHNCTGEQRFEIPLNHKGIDQGANIFKGFIDIVKKKDDGSLVIYDAKMKGIGIDKSDEELYRLQLIAYCWALGAKEGCMFVTYVTKKRTGVVVEQEELRYHYDPDDGKLFEEMLRKANFMQRYNLIEANRGFKWCHRCSYNGNFCHANFL